MKNHQKRRLLFWLQLLFLVITGIALFFYVNSTLRLLVVSTLFFLSQVFLAWLADVYFRNK